MLFAIAVSIAILLGFQLLMPHRPAVPPHQEVATKTTPASQSPAPTGNPAGPGTQPVQAAVPQNVPRVKISAPRIEGSLSLLGARIDDIVLRDYRETVDPKSPLVRLLEPRSDPQPYYVQYRVERIGRQHQAARTATRSGPPPRTSSRPTTRSR